MSHAWQIFDAAVRHLVAPESMKERLVGAYSHQLMVLQHDEIPEPIFDEFCELKNSLTRTKAEGNEGRVQASVMNMTDMEAFEHAKTILSLYSKLVELKAVADKN